MRAHRFGLEALMAAHHLRLGRDRLGSGLEAFDVQTLSTPRRTAGRRLWRVVGVLWLKFYARNKQE